MYSQKKDMEVQRGYLNGEGQPTSIVICKVSSVWKALRGKGDLTQRLGSPVEPEMMEREGELWTSRLGGPPLCPVASRDAAVACDPQACGGQSVATPSPAEQAELRRSPGAPE